MITAAHIKQFIKTKSFGVIIQYIKDDFSNTDEFDIIDEIYSRLVLQKNAKVAAAFKNTTHVMLTENLDASAVALLQDYVNSGLKS